MTFRTSSLLAIVLLLAGATSLLPTTASAQDNCHDLTGAVIPCPDGGGRRKRPTLTPLPTPTSTGTSTPTPTATATATLTPTATATSSATPTSTPTSTDTPTPAGLPFFGLPGAPGTADGLFLGPPGVFLIGGAGLFLAFLILVFLGLRHRFFGIVDRSTPKGSPKPAPDGGPRYSFLFDGNAAGAQPGPMGHPPEPGVPDPDNLGKVKVQFPSMPAMPGNPPPVNVHFHALGQGDGLSDAWELGGNVDGNAEGKLPSEGGGTLHEVGHWLGGPENDLPLTDTGFQAPPDPDAQAGELAANPGPQQTPAAQPGPQQAPAKDPGPIQTPAANPGPTQAPAVNPGPPQSDPGVQAAGDTSFDLPTDESPPG